MANEPAPLFDLSKKDFIKGLVTAGIVGALSVIAPAITAGTLFTLAVAQAAGLGAASGFVAYLLKNLLTNSQDKFLTKEPK